MPKCDCPTTTSVPLDASWYEPEEYKAMNHQANECPGDYMMGLYEREGEKLYLCSCCHLGGDILLEKVGEWD